MYIRFCVHPLIPLLDKCQTIAFLHIFNKLLYIFLLYMSRLSLSFFFQNGQSYRHRRGRNIHSYFVIYLQFLSYSIIKRIYIKVKRHLIYRYINGQYIFLKTRGRNIILPDMVDSTKEKQHCFNVECM